MKIDIANYNYEWPTEFRQIKKDLKTILRALNPRIEHIGSTAIPDLSAKPIIDIAVGIDHFQDLDRTVDLMIQNHYVYYQIYNSNMPQRRFFVGLKDKQDFSKFKPRYKAGDSIPHEEIQIHRLCHIHVWEYGTPEWIRHIAFRDYLIDHPTIQAQYEALKKQLSNKDWVDGNEYNDGKNDFIKTEEAKAISWYNEKVNPI